MAPARVIYKQSISGFWLTLATVVVMAAVGTWIKLTNGEPLADALKLGLPIFLGGTVFAYLLGYISRRKTVAVLATDGSLLTGWRASPIGRGARFAIPIAEIGNWRWFDSRQNRRSVVAVLEFSYGGEVFRLPPVGARKLEIDDLRKLAPLVVSDAVSHASIDLKGKGYGTP